MAQKELGAQKAAPSTSPVSPSTSSDGTNPVTPISGVSTGLGNPNGRNEAGAAPGRVGPKPKAKANTVAPKGRGAFSWGQLMWQKWYWGVFFAVAWAISSRLTGAS